MPEQAPILAIHDSHTRAEIYNLGLRLPSTTHTLNLMITAKISLQRGLGRVFP